MASPTLDPLPGTFQAQLVPICFQAALDGSNDATLVQGSRAIASVKHTATGVFRIKLLERWVALAAFVPGLKCPTVASLHVQHTADDVTASGGGYIDVTIVKPTNSSTTTLIATDPPAKSSNACVLEGTIWVTNLPTTVP